MPRSFLQRSDFSSRRVTNVLAEKAQDEVSSDKQRRSPISVLPTTVAVSRKRLRLSNDVQPHPGPFSGDEDGHDRSPAAPKTGGGKRPRRVKHPCCNCGRGVTAAIKAVSCDICERWTHLRCTGGQVTLDRYNHYVEIKADFSFLCDSCSLSTLPFHDYDCGDDCGDGDEALRDESQSSNANTEGVNPRQVGDISAAETGSNNADTSSALASSLAGTKGLAFLHVNARSLLPKLTEIRILLHDSKAAILAVTESWLDSSVIDGEVNIDGYNFVRKDRTRHGGGVGLYI